MRCFKGDHPSRLRFVSFGQPVLLERHEKITILAPNVTYFGSYLFEGCRDLTIYGHAGSNIETYAKENGIPFKAIK